MRAAAGVAVALLALPGLAHALYEGSEAPQHVTTWQEVRSNPPPAPLPAPALLVPFSAALAPRPSRRCPAPPQRSVASRASSPAGEERACVWSAWESQLLRAFGT